MLFCVGVWGRKARADVQARGFAVMRAGGGAASDLFLGAGMAPTGTGSLAPSAELDLSLAPALKLFTDGQADLERYFGTGGDAANAFGEMLVQLRPLSWLYPELYGSAQGAWYHDVLGPPDPSMPYEPAVSRSQLFSGGAALRAYLDTTEARVLFVAGERISTGAYRYVERPVTAQLSAATPLGRDARVAAFYRFTDNVTDALGYAYTSHELTANVLFSPLEGLALRAWAGFRVNHTSLGELDRFPHWALSAAYRVWGPVWLEATGSAELEWSHNPDGVSTLYTVYGGVRAEGGPWRL
ncbi:MAG: hypothetical protein JST54_27805 [Deltaproteobacteria bacterium]|nr:hypothetical protein [Deltaproteobacteria bacterium]